MKYYLSKLGFFLLTLWAAITLNFLIPRLQPGRPAEIIVKRLAGTVRPSTQLRSRRSGPCSAPRTAPCGSQYWTISSELVQGNLGFSFTYFPFPVTEVIGQAFRWTSC